MRKKDTSANGQHRLDEALATLIQNQAAFVAQQQAFVAQSAEDKRLHLEFEHETKERFARIEGQMTEIIRVLNEHGRQLERLTDAVREKIGFKGPQ